MKGKAYVLDWPEARMHVEIILHDEPWKAKASQELTLAFAWVNEWFALWPSDAQYVRVSFQCCGI